MPAPGILHRYPVLLWDFDGVIKESVDIKTRAYVALFTSFGEGIAERVRAHHEAHGGMSRFEKIPLYLEWAAQEVTDALVARYCADFGATVRQAVIDAEWVPGAREYLLANPVRQALVLVTATPQEEIEDIVRATALDGCFSKVFGAPIAKASAIRRTLAELARAPRDALMIGDSESDRSAADSAGTDFLLRRTPFNLSLQRAYRGPQCENFLDG
jgi:phosphoglycolate phosphatase-like HAD superfamily hydrolase